MYTCTGGKMRTIIGYVRVSTMQQDCANQRMAIFDYAHKNGLTINNFIESQASSRGTLKERKADTLLNLNSNDTIIVSEISRLGRSVSEVVQIINAFIKKKINFIAIKENIKIIEELDMQSKMLITLFSLFAEIERDLVSQRTKEALDALKRGGKRLGRPRGQPTKSKLDDKEDQIKQLVNLKISASAMGRIFGVDRLTVCRFIKRKNIKCTSATK